MRGQRRQQLPCGNDENIRILQRNGVGRPLLAVQRCDLAAYVAGSEKMQHDLLAVDVVVASLARPRSPPSSCRQGLLADR